VNRALRNAGLTLAGGAALAYGVHAAPLTAWIRPLRLAAWPGLSGLGDADHVALTFDDGPDRVSTPLFLDLLAERGVRATFFLLGFMIERDPGLAGEIVAAGHEVAIHGYQHINLLRRTPGATRDDINRAHDLIGETSGQAPRFYRPPYGVLTTTAALTARDLGLPTVLWSTWGKDWELRATPETVHRTVARKLTGGGTILLHDSDCTSSPDSWRATIGALPRLLDDCEEAGLQVGPLSEHGLR